MRYFFITLLSSFLLLLNAQAQQISFLTLSDIHYGSNNQPGDGQDSGDTLWDNALNKYNKLSQQVNFILLLGDLPTHLFGAAPEKSQYEEKIFQDLYTANIAHKPLFYIAGNNDSLSGNYQPFSADNRSPLMLAKNWQGACVYCEGLMIDKSHMQKEGYYASYVLPHNHDIILIALNATQFTMLSPFIPGYPNQEKDATIQLDWLKNQLKTLHAKQLLIAMHEPPGVDQRGYDTWHKNDLTQFVALLKTYQKNFGEINLLAGHSHLDEIRKLNISTNTDLYIYITPAISRIYNNNSAMKRFYLSSSLKLKEFITDYTSSSTTWKNEHYHGLNHKSAIFPECKGLILAQCFDKLPKERVCQEIETGKMNGAKSDKVLTQNCLRSYEVNSPEA